MVSMLQFIINISFPFLYVSSSLVSKQIESLNAIFVRCPLKMAKFNESVSLDALKRFNLKIELILIVKVENLLNSAFI